MRIFLLLLLVSECAFASITPYQNCVYVLLAKSCVISGDPDAPKFMIDQGTASCFVGDDLTQESNPKIAQFYQGKIQLNGLNREGHDPLIKNIRDCVSDPDKLNDCSFAKVMRVQDIEECAPFLNKPKINLLTTSHGLKSDIYELDLDDDWNLVSQKIYPDRRSFTFEKSDTHKILLTVSNQMTESQFAETRAKLEKSADKIFEPEGIEKISHKKVSINGHPDTDELVLISHNRVNASFAQYYIYGKNRIAILTYTTLGSHPDITNQSHSFVEKFIWK